MVFCFGSMRVRIVSQTNSLDDKISHLFLFQFHRDITSWGKLDSDHLVLFGLLTIIIIYQWIITIDNLPIYRSFPVSQLLDWNTRSPEPFEMTPCCFRLLFSSAKDNLTGEKVAIKKIANLFKDLKDTRRTLREIRLLRFLGYHENVRYIDIKTDQWTESILIIIMLLIILIIIILIIILIIIILIIILLHYQLDGKRSSLSKT